MCLELVGYVKVGSAKGGGFRFEAESILYLTAEEPVQALHPTS